MPLDPLLVNGLVPFGEGVARSMAAGAELANRRRNTDLYANRLAQAAEQVEAHSSVLAPGASVVYMPRK